MNLNQSIERMTDCICVILERNVHSIWLYGSLVLDDFRLGWSDVDLLVLTNVKISENQAQQLVGLRQKMLEAEPDNLYYRSFEGIITDKAEYVTESFSRLVYWGTSGQRITNQYHQDVFAVYELAKFGRSIYGSNDRKFFAEPSSAELRASVKQHYEAIRKYAVQTDEKLYSCGWRSTKAWQDAFHSSEGTGTFRDRFASAKKQFSFFMDTHGAPKGDFLKFIREIAEKKNCREIGEYRCQGFDTFGPFKLVGGIAKGHPTEKEIQGAVEFYRKLGD